eukprot:11215623-Lingulodinium_polyedra.AAC.1
MMLGPLQTTPADLGAFLALRCALTLGTRPLVLGSWPNRPGSTHCRACPLDTTRLRPAARQSLAARITCSGAPSG